MKFYLIPTVLTVILFSIWEVPPSYAGVVFGMALTLSSFLVVLDLFFFRAIANSTRVRAVLLQEKFVQDKKLQKIQSLFRSSYLGIGLMALIYEAPILGIWFSFTCPYLGLVYLAYVGNTYEEDLVNPEDFID